MEVRSDPVHQQEKCNTRYEAAYGRDNPGSIFRTAHFYRRYQQRPYGSRYHDTGSESQ